MARDARLPLEMPVESPELALVDPGLRALVLETPVPPTERRAVPELGAASAVRPEPVSATPFLDDAAREALSRLTELAELEPATRPRRSPTFASLAFAVAAWATLAVLLAELQPWRV